MHMQPGRDLYFRQDSPFPPNYFAMTTARFLALSTTIALSTVLIAQTDINKMVQDAMAKQAGGGSVKVTEDTDPFVPNDFIGSFTMEMHTFTGETEDKGSPIKITYHSDADKTLMQTSAQGMEGQEMKMMTDLKGKFQYMLMTDKKGKKTAMKQKKMKVTVADEKSKDQPVVKRTDAVKTIQGHTCTKYIATSKDGEWVGWVAPDVKAPFTDMTRNSAKGSESINKGMGEMPGMPLEWEYVSADGKQKGVCYVRNLVVGNVSGDVFNLDGYEVMDMTAMPMFGK